MPPPEPTRTVTLHADRGHFEVGWTVPAPTGEETAAVEVRVWRRERRPGGDWQGPIRRTVGEPAAQGVWVETTGVHQMDYQFAPQAVDADGSTTMYGGELTWQDIDPDVTWADLQAGPSWGDIVFGAAELAT